MPQMTKGGKFIFGKSLLREDGFLRPPRRPWEEYRDCIRRASLSFHGQPNHRRLLRHPQRAAAAVEAWAHFDGYARPDGLYRRGRRVSALQRALVRLDGHFSRWNADAFRTDDAISEIGSGNGTAFHPQQRYRLYHGSQRPASGKGGKLSGRDSRILTKAPFISHFYIERIPGGAVRNSAGDFASVFLLTVIGIGRRACAESAYPEHIPAARAVASRGQDLRGVRHAIFATSSSTTA